MLLLLQLMGLVAMSLHLPGTLLREASSSEALPFLVVLAALALLRYGPRLALVLRAVRHIQVVVPRLRARLGAEAAGATVADAEAAAPPDLGVIVTSPLVSAETTTAVFRHLVTEADAWPGDVTLVAVVAELADERLIKKLFDHLRPGPNVRLVLVRPRRWDEGEALAMGLTALSRTRPSADAVVAILAGDMLVPGGSLARVAPVFRARPDIDCVVTDEAVVGADGALAEAWFGLASARRHLLAAAAGGGRGHRQPPAAFAAFRLSGLLDDRLVAALRGNRRDDRDDGSALRRLMAIMPDRFRSFYLSDVQVIRVRRSRAHFAASLPERLRQEIGERRLAFGRWRVGLRAALTTAEAVTFLLLSVTIAPVFLYAYAMWLLATRLIDTFLLWLVRPVVRGLYPLLIALRDYAEVYFAFMVPARLMPVGSQASGSLAGWCRGGLALAAVGTLVGYLTGVLAIPDLARVTAAF